MTVWIPKRFGFGRNDGGGAVIDLSKTGQGEGYVPRPTFSDGMRHSIRTRVNVEAAKAAVLRYAGTDHNALPPNESPDAPGRNQGVSNTMTNTELEAKVDACFATIERLTALVEKQVQAKAAPAPTPEPEPAPAPAPAARPQPVATRSPGGYWAAPGVTWQAFKAAKAAVRNRTYRYGGGWQTRKGYRLPRAIFVTEVDAQLVDWGWSPFYAQVQR